MSRAMEIKKGILLMYMTSVASVTCRYHAMMVAGIWKCAPSPGAVSVTPSCLSENQGWAQECALPLGCPVR